MEFGTLKNYIDGDWVESKSDTLLDVTNPATGEVIAKVPLSTPAEMEQAVLAAKEAFWEWRETPPVVRARYMFRLKALMEKHFEHLAQTIVKEHGKILDEARGEVRRAIENVDMAAGIPSLMMGYNAEDIADGIDEEAVLQPVGVFGCVAPFNFPSMVPFWFLPTGIACGNPYIVKPSEQCPVSQTLLFELLDELDFPPGVVNMVHGAKPVVDVLLTHPDVAGISFVGSTPVGKYIYSTAAAHGKRVQVQGGAKNGLVVMPDAVLGRTVAAFMTSAFGTAGQRCLAGALALPVGDIYEPFKAMLVEEASKIKVGDGLDQSVQMGPVSSKKALDRITGYIEKGVAEGADLLLDGRGVQVEGYPNGYFIGPTIFDKVTPDMTIAKEEIFGPVLGIIPLDSFDDAIEVIRGLHYGNAASIFTSSGKWAREFRYRVPAGNIGVNIGIAAPIATFAFGGQGDSFFGDLHGQGMDGVTFFTDRKIVITRWF
jgi:malonate-semialdehyde dehydrogenase (acetylating)/methylmalonate-semialdehyde dehydrogenase